VSIFPEKAAKLLVGEHFQVRETYELADPTVSAGNESLQR